MVETTYLFLVMVAMSGVTLLLRAAPFIFIKDRSQPFVRFLSDAMPPGIMVILVFYSLTSISFGFRVEAVSALLSLIFVVSAQHLLRNPLLSIVMGTLINVVILNYFGGGK